MVSVGNAGHQGIDVGPGAKIGYHDRNCRKLLAAELGDTVPISKMESPTPRCAVMSMRNMDNHVARSHGYEFEDTILDGLEEAVLFAPGPGRLSGPMIRTKNWLARRTPRAAALPSGLHAVHLRQDVDLFFYSVAHLRDLNALSALHGWRRHAARAVCWLQELWIDGLDRERTLVERLNQFDLVVCSFAETVAPLQKRLSVPVVYLPWGVDTLAFCPFPNPPRRAIDMLSIGVRHPETHAGLIDHADRTGQFYSYETISGRAVMQDYRAHRQNYIGQLKRSRYFFSYLAKVERLQERGRQAEFGLRYIEGAAAGAVLLGNRIDSLAFKENFGWEDAVIDVPYACPDIGEIIAGLDAQPERLAAIRRRNILESLKRHDHLYRWEQVLELVGMTPHPKLLARRAALAERIEMVAQG